MNCPRCSKNLNKYTNHDIEIDVCDTGCGGIWFDWLELKKMDEKHEADPDFVEQLSKTPTQKIDLSEKMNCLKCEDIVMVRKFFSHKQQVEFDECGKCGSMWLDAGELTDIHEQYDTEEERQKAAQAFIKEITGGQLEPKDVPYGEQHGKLVRALRFISPSYYLNRD